MRSLFSQFVELGQFAAEAAARGGRQILPVLVLASTRAGLASLEDTCSRKATVGDIALKPLSTPRMREILEDLHARIVVPHKPDALVWTQQLHLALTWLSGNPRHLAWLLSDLSGQSPSHFKDGLVSIGKYPDHTDLSPAYRDNRWDTLEGKAL